jgi:acyl-CoA synthetase (AMP-forming)/AMP-acid ligase II|tara:strand:- start:40 stop:1308 length:1269 start_codon:yes stop_codon:yes gene_type:complete
VLDLALDNKIAIGQKTYSWHDFNSIATDCFALISDSKSPLAIIVDDTNHALQYLLSLFKFDLDGIIIFRTRYTQAVEDLLIENCYSILDSKNSKWIFKTDSVIVNKRISLLTSGTTGTPKLIHHSWDSINTSSNISTINRRTWLLPYQIGTYAWFQLVTLSMFSKNQNLVIDDVMDFEKMFQRAYEHDVNAISATPTFWRMACMQVPDSVLKSINFIQISLGGEIVDSSILKLLKEMYPNARLTHIYASSEAGASIVVNDGLAGFPESFLASENKQSINLKIENGILYVHSKFAAINALDEAGWVNTRDRVEIQNGRVFIKGRADSSMINVGGSKAYPSDIESVLMSHESVDWCRVRAVRAPFIGYLPEVDIKISIDSKTDDIEKELISFCQDKIPDYAIPRVWNFVTTILISDTLKTDLIV